jgi:hypothetical protein
MCEERIRGEPTNDGLFLVSIVGGRIGAAAMYFVVRVLNMLGWAKGDILLAIGSIFLHRRKSSFQLGLLLHVVICPDVFTRPVENRVRCVSRRSHDRRVLWLLSWALRFVNACLGLLQPADAAGVHRRALTLRGDALRRPHRLRRHNWVRGRTRLE